jgi:spore coat polysaccharide biosynthesis protein SpsF
MTVACIVQARMGSTRFPGKVLADLAGKPVLQHVLERCKEIKGVDVVVCAIPLPDYADLGSLISDCDVIAYSYLGSEDDVLGRYLAAAQFIEATTIMRITADCPLIDPDVCEQVLAKFQDGRYDYVSNVHPRTWPKGYDCEVFSFEALEWADTNAVNEYEREHVTPDMVLLKRANVEAPYDASHVNYCIDYPEDIARLEQVMKEAA